MQSVFNAFLDMDRSIYCCTKRTIKMNIRHQNGRPFSQLNYYFLFLYYYIITFTALFVLIVSNILPYTIHYLTSYYLPIWSIVYISNTITFCILISSFFLMKQFVKDVLCKCPEP